MTTGQNSTNPRAISPFPTHNTPINITHAVVNFPDSYRIPVDEDYRSLAISSMPKYLKLCAQRLNARCIENHEVDPKMSIVLRAAFRSGLNQLQTDLMIKELLELKHQTCLIDAGDMMADEAAMLNDTWSFTPPAPSGIMQHPFRIKLIPEVKARLSDFADKLGLSQSCLAITCLAFGFFNQPEIDSTKIESHGYAIATTVHNFDAKIRLKIELARAFITLMKDAEQRAKSIIVPRVVDLSTN